MSIYNIFILIKLIKQDRIEQINLTDFKNIEQSGDSLIFVNHSSILGDALKRTLIQLAFNYKIYEISSKNQLPGYPTNKNILIRGNKIKVLDHQNNWVNINLDELNKICV